MRLNKLTLTLIAAFALISCGDKGTTTLINSGVTAGISLGLKYAPIPETTKAKVRDYGYVISGAVRTITGNPTAEEFTVKLKEWVPENIRQEVPQIETVLFPLIASAYQTLRDQYGSNHEEFLKALNGLATAIEAGLAK